MLFLLCDKPAMHYKSTYAAEPSKAKRLPANVAWSGCVGTAMFVLEEVGCEVVEVRDPTVLTGVRVGTAEEATAEETAEQLSQPWRHQ